MALKFTSAPHKTEKIKRSGPKEKFAAVTSADCVFLRTMKRVQLLLKTEIDDKWLSTFSHPLKLMIPENSSLALS